VQNRLFQLAPRHCSLQNFTSSQFFAQLLRHIIERPQAAQVFGSWPVATSRRFTLSGIVSLQLLY
jgi:hypothetical protein